MLPVPVMEAVVSRATPKSMIFTEPSVWMKMLAGLMSRWTIPAWWAWASPASTCTMTATLRSAARGGCWGTALLGACPLRGSLGVAGGPSRGADRAETIHPLGGGIFAAARAARPERRFLPGGLAVFGAATL